MLYIVMLPVKTNNVRNVAVIHAVNYKAVRELLHLPDGWNNFVQITDIELEAIMQAPENYQRMYLGRDSY